MARELRLHRESVERYLAVLERLFLIRRLRPWHRNAAKRLVKSPKTHLLDTGLATTLAGLTAHDWLAERPRMGRLLESFVVQQLIAQAAWTDPNGPALRFWHYRDKDQVEVDIVMTQANAVWGIEVKAAMSLARGDGKGLTRLAQACGKDFQQGILLYGGTDSATLGRQANARGADKQVVEPVATSAGERPENHVQSIGVCTHRESASCTLFSSKIGLYDIALLPSRVAA